MRFLPSSESREKNQPLDIKQGLYHVPLPDHHGKRGACDLYVVRSVVETEGEVECDDERVEDGFRFPAAHQRLMISGIPSTARVRLEIAQRRVCTSSLSSGKLRKKKTLKAITQHHRDKSKSSRIQDNGN